MPEAKADALGGDARMTALVSNAVTFSERRLPWPMTFSFVQAIFALTERERKQRKDDAGATC